MTLRPKTRRLLIVLLAAAMSAGLLVTIVVAPAAGAPFGIIGTLFAVLGAVVVTRQPGNRIAYLMLLLAGWITINQVAYFPILSDVEAITPVVFVALLLTNSLWLPIFLTLFHLLFVFPTGRLLSPRWRWIYVVEVGTWLSFVSAIFLTAEIGPPDGAWTLPNPAAFWGGQESLANMAMGLMGVGWLVLAIAGLTSVVARWRRSTWAERNQMRLALVGLVVGVAGFIFQNFASGAGGPVEVITGVVFFCSTVAVPVLMTVAIVRHGLFEIDRIISRTVAYAIVVAILVLAYVVGTVYLPIRITGGRASPAFVAGTTLALAAAFNPLRRRVQARVDRRFYRFHYDAEREVEAFAVRLRDQVDADQLSEAWLDTVGRVFQPTSMRLWVRGGDT